MIKITLNKIKDNSPCKSGWQELLHSFNKTKADDTEVAINHLLESNAISDTLWVIYNCIEDELDKKREMIHEIAYLAIEPAESVLHIFEEKYPDDKRPREAIEAAKEYFENPCEENAAAAARAARAAADAAADAAYAADDAYAAFAARAARAAADAAADAAEVAADDAYAAFAAFAARAARAAAVFAAATRAAFAAAAFAAAAFADDTYAAEVAAEMQIREKQKEIILKYFGE